MPTQLQLYNLALSHLKSQSIASVAEATERRRVLDIFYTSTLALMLEKGFWKFAMRTVQVDADGAITPAFGQSHAFTKPEDWVKTYWVSGNQLGDPPLEGWIEEANMWFADIDPIYVRYVSNDDSDYGGDLARWTQRYTMAVSLELAWWACPKITGSGELQDGIRKQADNLLSQALSHEALREPVRRSPEGKWNQSRRGWGAGPRRYPGGYQF